MPAYHARERVRTSGVMPLLRRRICRDIVAKFDLEMEKMSKFLLGWFMNFIPPEWDTPWASPDAAKWPNGRFYVDMAKSMERACFDYIMIEDTVMVARRLRG